MQKLCILLVCTSQNMMWIQEYQIGVQEKTAQVNYVYNFQHEIFQASSFSDERNDSKLPLFFNNNGKYSES